MAKLGVPANISKKRKREEVLAKPVLIQEIVAKIALTDEEKRDGMLLHHKAAKEGFANFITPLVKAGRGLELTDKKGNTALHWAAYGGDVATVNVLLDLGALRNPLNKAKQTPEMLAQERGNEHVAKILRVEDEKTTEDEFLQLIVAGKIELFTDDCIESGEYPIHKAIERNWPNALAELLVRNIDLCQRNGLGYPPLLVAIQQENVPIIRQLIKAEAPLDWEDPKDGQNLLHSAADEGSVEVLTEIVNSMKANEIDFINKQDDEGYTPLVLAVANGHEGAIRYLLQQGASAHIKNKEGTAITIAKKKGLSADIIQLLEASPVLPKKAQPVLNALELHKVVKEPAASPILPANRCRPK